MSADIIDLAQARDRLRPVMQSSDVPHVPRLRLSVNTSADMVHELFQHMEPEDFLDFMMATRHKQHFDESDQVVQDLVGYYYLMRTAEGTHP